VDLSGVGVVVSLVGVGVGVGVVVDSASVGVVAGLFKDSEKGIKQSNEKTQKEFDNVKQRDQNNKLHQQNEQQKLTSENAKGATKILFISSCLYEG
jgi:hypothetical protein